MRPKLEQQQARRDRVERKHNKEAHLRRKRKARNRIRRRRKKEAEARHALKHFHGVLKEQNERGLQSPQCDTLKLTPASDRTTIPKCKDHIGQAVTRHSQQETGAMLEDIISTVSWNADNSFRTSGSSFMNKYLESNLKDGTWRRPPDFVMLQEMGAGWRNVQGKVLRSETFIEGRPDTEGKDKVVVKCSDWKFYSTNVTALGWRLSLIHI